MYSSCLENEPYLSLGIVGTWSRVHSMARFIPHRPSIIYYDSWVSSQLYPGSSNILYLPGICPISGESLLLGDVFAVNSPICGFGLGPTLVAKTLILRQYLDNGALF